MNLSDELTQRRSMRFHRSTISPEFNDMSAFIMKPVTALASFVRRFKSSNDGIAAVEFALIVPIMLAMFIGVVEMSQAITVDRRVSHVAASTADLVARQRQITSTTLDGYMQIINQLLSPYAAGPLKLTVSNVYNTAAAKTTHRLCWVYQHGGGANTGLGGTGPRTTGNYTGLPTGVLDETTGGTSVVVVEVRYLYQPVMFVRSTSVHGANVGSFIGAAGINMTETFYLKPRLSESIQWGTETVCV